MDTAIDSGRPKRRRLHGAGVVLSCAFALCACLGGCKRNVAFERFMRPRSTQATDKSSLSIDQLKDAIAEYSTVAERKKYATAAELGLDASSNLGAYRIYLADRYIEKKMFKDAYDVLVLASKSYPADARIYLKAGVSAAYVAKAAEIKGRAGLAERDSWLDISESCYKRALSIDPRSTQALYGLAVLYAFEMDRPADAIGHLSTLLGIETKNVDAMLLIARCYAELGKAEEAADWYETAARTTVVPEKRAAAEANRAQVLAELEGKKNGK
jgi:tetratricopeptide (TPR) repeat protein